MSTAEMEPWSCCLVGVWGWRGGGERSAREERRRRQRAEAVVGRDGQAALPAYLILEPGVRGGCRHGDCETRRGGKGERRAREGEGGRAERGWLPLRYVIKSKSFSPSLFQWQSSRVDSERDRSVVVWVQEGRGSGARAPFGLERSLHRYRRRDGHRSPLAARPSFLPRAALSLLAPNPIGAPHSASSLPQFLDRQREPERKSAASVGAG